MSTLWMGNIEPSMNEKKLLELLNGIGIYHNKINQKI